MIIANMKGGLGNQLFQYACGRALALQNSDELKLDVTGYGESNGIDTVRHYSLSPFDIHASIAAPEEIRRIKYPRGLISKGLRFFQAKILRKFTVGYDPAVLRRTGDIYLDGFFQTERYFRRYADAIRADLSLKAGLTGAAGTIAAEIKASPDCISLHVRRGDYVRDAKTQAYHGGCSPAYYAEALKRIEAELAARNNHANTADADDPVDLKIFVFSDDIAWVKQNMPLSRPTTYVSQPAIADHEELALMSLCAHNIIANSSFSWWGAWLNAHPRKIVIAPREWTRRGHWRHRDTVPPEWLKI